jgi:hypothetical protein
MTSSGLEALAVSREARHGADPPRVAIAHHAIVLLEIPVDLDRLPARRGAVTDIKPLSVTAERRS